MARPDCSAASNRSASSSRPSRRKPISSASSSKTLLPIGRFFAASLLKSQNHRPGRTGIVAGRGQQHRIAQGFFALIAADQLHSGLRAS